MATPFINIFDEVLEREVRYTDILGYTDDRLNRYLSSLLMGAREILRDVIVSEPNPLDLNKCEDVIEFQRTTYNLTTSTAGLVATLSPAPPDNAIFYVDYRIGNGSRVVIDSTNFAFDSNDNSVTITGLPDGDKLIYIGAYVNGQFNQTLNLTEFGLMVRAMGVVSLRDKIKDTKNINHQVVGRDYGFSGTQANFLRALDETYRKEYDDLDSRIMMYTYRNSLTNLMNLGGQVQRVVRVGGISDPIR